MPRKIRELISDYRKAGFIYIKGGKGSHRKLRHPTGITVILSGNDGDDAKNYQERELKRKIKEALIRGK